LLNFNWITFWNLKITSNSSLPFIHSFEDIVLMLSHFHTNLNFNLKNKLSKKNSKIFFTIFSLFF
jgi:hypothetical protein